MKLRSLLTLSALVLGSAAFAKADVLSIVGSDTYTSTTVTFDPTAIVVGGSTGIFSGFTSCLASPAPSPCSVTMYGPLVYAGSPFSPTKIFSVVDGTNTATVTLNTITSVTDDVDITGDATILVNGATLDGLLKITTQFGNDPANSDVSFSATTTTSPVPEPSTFALLGTGLLSVAGVARRKFRS